MSVAKWQRDTCVSLIWTSSGSLVAQMAWAIGQRVWKRQPAGGSIGEGGSPCSTMRSRSVPSFLRSSGAADINARVYGCPVRSYTSAYVPSSTTRPRYMVATRSEMCLTICRSWAMNR